MKKVYLSIISISLFLIILLSSLFISAFNKDFYVEQFHINNSYNNQMVKERNINPEIITNEIIDYLKDNNDNLNRNGYFEREEIIHMKDVKNLFIAGEYLLIILSIILICSLFLLHKKHLRGRKYFKSILTYYFTWSILIIIGLFLCFLNFSDSFIVFHKLLFTNDYWLLSPNTSIIINIMPESFFLAHTINIFKLFLSFSLALTIILSIMIYLFKKESKEDPYANIRK